MSNIKIPDEYKSELNPFIAVNQIAYGVNDTKIAVCRNDVKGQFYVCKAENDANFIDLACETLFNYYSAAINAATIRSGNGEVGTSFTYYDALRNTTVTSNDKANMRSAWDHKDVNSGEDISKKTGQSATGVYIGHDKESGGGNDNDKFYIYLNIDEICAKLLQIMQGDLRQSLQ